jgi:hypothetical protein
VAEPCSVAVQWEGAERCVASTAISNLRKEQHHRNIDSPDHAVAENRPRFNILPFETLKEDAAAFCKHHEYFPHSG